jgi:HEPN domain-containing protein
MRTPDQVRQDVIRQWMESARQDLALADLALRTPAYDGWAQIGFHAQQAVEKMLKALLVA